MIAIRILEFRIFEDPGGRFDAKVKGMRQRFHRRRMAECFHLSVGLRLVHVLARGSRRLRPAERSSPARRAAGRHTQ